MIEIWRQNKKIIKLKKIQLLPIARKTWFELMTHRKNCSVVVVVKLWFSFIFIFFHFWLDSSLYIQTYGWRAVAQMSGHAMLLPCCCCCCCYENPLIITRSCNCLKLKWSHQEFEFHPPAKWELDLYFCKNRRAKAGGPCQQREIL